MHSLLFSVTIAMLIARRNFMNISLTAELEGLINTKVASGMYHSASEVIREALRLLREHDDLKKIRFEDLRRDIAVGLEQSRRGESMPLDIDAIKSRVLKHSEKKRKAA